MCKFGEDQSLLDALSLGTEWLGLPLAAVGAMVELTHSLLEAETI